MVDYMLLPVPLSRRALSLAAVAFGAALLVWQVREIGAAQIARGFAAVGAWGAAAILVLSGLRFLARSTGWTALLTTDTPPGHALGAVIAGDAAGNLTPLSMLVSEPAKAAVLAWAVPGVGTKDALAALAAETFFFGVSVALYVLLGVGALLYAYDIDASLRLGGLVTLAAMTVALVVAAWMALKQPTLAGSTLARAPFGFLRTLAERVRAFERTAYGTTMHPGARLGVVASAAVSFHALSFLELWLTLWLLTGESRIVAALVLDTVGRLTNALFKVIPMQIGVLQVGSELVARAIGLAPGIGLMVSLLRTARVILWTAVGLLILGKHGSRKTYKP